VLRPTKTPTLRKIGDGWATRKVKDR
jgi:hypothetical protein